MVSKASVIKNPLEEERLHYKPPLPHVFNGGLEAVEGESTAAKSDVDVLRDHFPNTFGRSEVSFRSSKSETTPKRVGVVLSGGQAPGGHNVICGLFDALPAGSTLIGFLGGPSGIIHDETCTLDGELLDRYRNTGGFDLIGAGRTKIETPDQLNASLETVKRHKLDGLVIIGGDDSNTNAAVLAEYFISEGCPTQVVGVPKTIDGDLKNERIPISFGFDTACKSYAEMIGNLCRDALSAKKYTHFVKLMGRSASHVTLECALQTHPNYALIAEEKKPLETIVHELTDLIIQRAAAGKNYGVILIPEGLIEFIPGIAKMIEDLPQEVQQHLQFALDDHGNVKVSQIATEQLLIHLVSHALQKRPDFHGTFTPVSHFFGYEGRAGYPSNFDAAYCQALGYTAAALIQSKRTGYMARISNLTATPSDWEVGGIPLTMLMNMEERKGTLKPVIQKALVDLNGAPFLHFASHRASWALDDAYRYPGPLQFAGPTSLTDSPTLTLSLESS